MATQYKFTFILNMGRNGWSESFYGSAGTIAGAIIDLQALGVLRYGLLGKGVSIDGIRLQFPIARGSTQLLSVTPPVPAITVECKDPWDSALFSMRAQGVDVGDTDSIYRRNFELRGLPRDAVSGGQATGETLNAPYDGNWTSFLSKLISMGGALKVTKKSTAVAVISTANTTVQGAVTFGTIANHGYFVGQEISLSGMKYSFKPLNGRNIVSAVPDAQHFTIMETGPAGVFFAPAFSQSIAPGFVPINSGQFLRTVKRDTGRAFFATAGRSKTRAISI